MYFPKGTEKNSFNIFQDISKYFHFITISDILMVIISTKWQENAIIKIEIYF